MNRTTVVLILGLLAVVALPGSAAIVLVTSHGVSVPTGAIAEAINGTDGSVRRCTIVVDRCVLDLSGGAWDVRVVAPGVYSTPSAYAEAAGVATANVHVWPAATITGLVRSIPSTDLPAEIGLRVTAAEQGLTVPTHEIRCEIRDRRFACQVPAGTLNLRLRAIGRISHYFWDVATLPNKETPLGVVELKRGASLVGKVYLARKLRGALSRAVVTLRATLEGSNVSGRTLQRRMTTQADRRGFFHFDGVPPGEYKLTASLDNLQSAEVTIVIVEGREAALQEGLVLAPPRSLRIAISPPVGPNNLPWRVSVARRVLNFFDDRKSFTSVDGVVSIPRIAPGDYEAQISLRDGDRWAVREFTVDEDSISMDIHIPVIRVSGIVRLGARPIAARVTLGGQTGVQRIPLVTDEKGAFSELLAEMEDIGARVLVESELPQVKRELRNIPVRRTADGLELEIILPPNGMSGLVTDEAGKPLVALVAADVSASSPERIRVRSEKDGRFELVGITKGIYRVQAQAYDENRLLESELKTLEVAENDVTHVTLVLRPGSKFMARVLSTAGPVSGAEVAAMARDVDQLNSIWRTTDETGLVTSDVPPRCQMVDVVVRSPGFATQFFRTQELGSVMPIALHQRAGTLVIETDAIGPTAVRTAILRHRNAAVPLLTFLNRATFEQLSGNRYRILVPGLEDGEYAFCEVSGAPESAVRRISSTDCTTGFLAAGGRLSLSGKIVAH